jgi:hypothetical protein
MRAPLSSLAAALLLLLALCLSAATPSRAALMVDWANREVRERMEKEKRERERKKRRV